MPELLGVKITTRRPTLREELVVVHPVRGARGQDPQLALGAQPGADDRDGDGQVEGAGDVGEDVRGYLETAGAGDGVEGDEGREGEGGGRGGVAEGEGECGFSAAAVAGEG